MLSAYFVRSVVPHARITRIDVEAARALPGVAAVYTPKDFELNRIMSDLVRIVESRAREG